MNGSLKFSLAFSLTMFATIHLCAQRIVVVAVNGGRSFSRVELNEKYIGTIDDGEHLEGVLIKGENRVAVEQRGYEGIELVFENNDEDVVIEIRASSRNIRARILKGAESQYSSLFESIPQNLRVKETDRRGFSHGELPKRRSTIMAHINDPVAACSNHGFVENQIIACFMSNYLLVDRGLVETVLNEQRLSMSGLVSQSTLIDAGKITGASYVLDLNVECMGPEKVNVVINIVSVETSELTWLASFRGINVDAIFSRLSPLLNH